MASCGGLSVILAGLTQSTDHPGTERAAVCQSGCVCLSKLHRPPLASLGSKHVPDMTCNPEGPNENRKSGPSARSCMKTQHGIWTINPFKGHWRIRIGGRFRNTLTDSFGLVDLRQLLS